MLVLIVLSAVLRLSPYVGVAAYLGLSIGLRSLLTSDHRWGMLLIRRGRYSKAVSVFEKSYRFFSRWSWLDRGRYLLLLSSNRMSYREMALVNMAFCQIQLGDEEQAKILYQQALAEFNSAMAQAALKELEN